MLIKSYTKEQAITQAQKQSKTEYTTVPGKYEDIKQYHRVCVFESAIDNQNFKKGEWYISVISENRSFNIGGKINIITFKNGVNVDEEQCKFRIDNSYEKIYIYDNGAYYFYSSFFAIGITADMTEKQQLEIIEEDYLFNP